MFSVKILSNSKEKCPMKRNFTGQEHRQGFNGESSVFTLLLQTPDAHTTPLSYVHLMDSSELGTKPNHAHS